ncbi:reverse transcriptase domain-containing protein [Ferrovibrio sp.]|uniref:reverse transcriptase domain-containing protein n=1 Tax=Ferrovibrio sp. TaxID=1917215 RepID=UPI00311E5500
MLPPLVVRAINHARREYLPTYLGLRLLFDGRDKQGSNEWAADFVNLQAANGRNLPYFRYQILKGLEKHEVKYRDCFAPSPSALLAEIYTLFLMSKSPSFEVPTSAYSYRWPSDRYNAGNPFEFFMTGYERRKKAISRSLSMSRDHVAVITDIKAFYPSCDSGDLLRRMENRLASSSLTEGEQDVVRWCSENLLSQPGYTGIPIGTALGHTFGHIALEDVDRSLIGMFGENYFRYVDDITIVVPAAQANEAESIVRREVEKCGYQINKEKTEVVSVSNWNDPSFEENRETSFSALRHMILIFLALRPQQFPTLKQALRGAGYALPLDQFKRVAEYSRFRAAIRRFELFFKFGLTEVPDVQGILLQASRVRRKIQDDYERLSGETSAMHGSQRKWFVQKVKWNLNRLIYLSDKASLSRILPTIPDYEELDQIRAVVADVSASEISKVVEFPGPTVNAFSQLWQFHENEPQPEHRYLRSVHRDAAAILGLWGVTKIPTHLVEAEETIDNNLLLKFCYSQSPTVRELRNQSYIDELRTLQIGRTEADIQRLMASRYDDLEFILLDGLMIGMGNYS